MKPLPKTRSAAIKAGATAYFTGKPCKRGHITTRPVDTSECRTCRNNRNRNRCREFARANVQVPKSEWPEIIRLYTEDKLYIRQIHEKLGIHKHIISKILHLKGIVTVQRRGRDLAAKGPKWVDHNKPMGARMSDRWRFERYAGQRYEDVR